MAGVFPVLESHARGILAGRQNIPLVVVVVAVFFLQACLGQSNRDDIARQQVYVGDTITLNCSAKPTDIPSYRWVYIRLGTKRPQVLSSGRSMVVQEPRFSLTSQLREGKVNLQLKLTDVRSHESGLFMCWQQGQKPDPQVMVTVLEDGSQSEQQTITRTENPEVVQYGESATFSCYIQPAWPIRVTWLKDGKFISLRDRLYTQTKKRLRGNPQGRDQSAREDQLVASLFVASVRKDATFTCRIETNPPGEQSMQITVRVPRVESLTAEPHEDVVEYGQPLSLTCVISGSNSEVVWLKDGSELLFGPNFPGRRKQSTMQPPNRLVSTVEFEAMSFADNGQYVCYIPGASRHILINIEGRPPRLLEVTGRNFFEDEDLTLRCTTQYSRNAGTQQTVSWTFEGAVMDPSTYDSLTFAGDHNTTIHQLTLSHATAGNIGTYQCITPYGSKQTAVEMYIPPSLREPLPSEVPFKEDDFFRLPCLTTGYPQPSVHWERRTGDVWVSVESAVGAGSAALVFPRASVTDAGTYRCVAKSEAGSFLAEVAAVAERVNPEILEIVAPESVVVGDNFTVQCTVRNWEGEIEFTLNGVSLMSALAERFNVLRYPMEERLMEAFLIVRESKPEDSGQYLCLAGSQMSPPASVLVKEPEPEVLDMTASPAIMGREFSIQCIVNNWNEPVTFVFNNKVVEPEEEGLQYSVVSDVEGEEDMPVTQIFTHTLTVPTTTNLHNGHYECYTGPSASASLNVTVWDVPEVSLDLQNKGERNWRDTPTPITCKIKGVSPDVVTVLFSHENTPQVSIENRTKMSSSSQLVNVAVSEGGDADDPYSVFTLGFYSLSKDFEGLWSCEVFHPSGISLNKDTLVLEIYEPPEFIDVPPEEVFEEEGRDLRLNCSVSGPPDTMVAWYRQGIQEPIVFELLRATLFIPRFTITDEGHYVCRAASHDREILSTTHLRLGTAQPRVESMVVSPAVVGQEFSVTCTVSNWNREVLFFHNSESVDLAPGSRYSVHRELPGFGSGHNDALSHVLTIVNAAAADSGVIECILTTDIFGRVEVEVQESQPLPTPVTVDEFELLQPSLPPGRIVELTGPESVVKGEELLLTCLVSPIVQQDIVLIHSNSYLYVGGITLAEDPRVEILLEMASDSSRILHLRIADVKQMDEGTYQCATSTEPPAYSSLTVSVEASQKPTELPQSATTNPPDIVSTRDIPVNVTVLPGEDVTFPCTVPAVIDFNKPLSQRQHYIFWNRIVDLGTETIVDNNEIVHHEANRMSVNYSVDRNSETTTYDLTLKMVEQADTGRYICSTERFSFGYEDTKTYHLKVDSPGQCEFPSEWQGQWYDTKYRQVSDIGPQEFKRSTCILTSEGNYIIQHNRRQCYRCVYFSQKHQNLLQYKISKCKKKLEAELLCSSVARDDVFISLVRLNTEAVACPFTGPRKYLVELQHQTCTDDPSLITSSTASLLKFQYPTCWVLGDPSRPVAEEFECVADWSDGSAYYLITRLLSNSSLYLEQKYRCFTYTYGENGEYSYLMGHNESPACGVIGERFTMTYKISELIGESPLSVTGMGIKDITVESSEVAVLPCRASVLLGSDDPSKKYMITWVREGKEGEMAVVSRDDFLAMEHGRYSLDIASIRPGNTSKYDLVIANVQPSDAGTYHCMLRKRKGGGHGVSHVVTLAVAESPKFEKCVLPLHWSGEWWSGVGDTPIGDGIFGGMVCDVALGDKYFMRGPTCNMCLIIRETHFNLLHFKKSPCERTDDMNTLCDMIEEQQPRQTLIRKNAGITCPFPGSRSFVHQLPQNTCEETHSQLISNGTQLQFMHNECHFPRDLNQGPATTLVQCVAIWSEGSTHYLMGKVAHDGGYRCFTFEEAMNQDHLFTMGQAETEVCTDLAASEANTLYRIFGESKAPEAPVIEGDEASRQVLLGDAITLTCSSRGGVPPPTLKWYKVVDGFQGELLSETLVFEGVTKAELHIKVDATDKHAAYNCEASNFATETPLNASTSLTFLRDYANIMLQQVVVVEYQPAFLPCVHTLEDDLLMEWFDVDLEMKITSGNQTVIQDPNIVPYIHGRVMGLMVTSSFLDTTYSCSINGIELGSTTLIIYPKYLVLEESQAADPFQYFMSTSSKVQPPLGHPATLDCSVDSNVTSTSSNVTTLVSWWRYPGTTLLTQGSVNFAEQDGYKLDVHKNSYQLTVSNTTLKHSGLYICQVAFNEVELYRRNFSINVEGLLTTRLDDSVSINCYSPEGNVTFLLNGKELMPSKYALYKYIWEETTVHGNDGVVFTLTVTDVTEEDCGVYTCVSTKHRDHVLQETSVSLLGEEVITLTTTTIRTTQESTPPATTEMLSTVAESTTHTTDSIYTQDKAKEDIDYENPNEAEVPDITTTMTIPTTEKHVPTTEKHVPTTEKHVPTTEASSPTTTSPATSIYTTTSPATTTIPAFTTLPITTTTSTTTTTTPTTTTTTPTTTTEPPSYEEIVLSCKGYDSDYTIWDYNGRTLFLGPIDMAGILGTALSPSGDLVLIAGPYPELRDNDTYSCYFESEESGEVEPAPELVVTYHLTLINDVALVDENLVGTPNGIPLPEPEPEPKPELESEQVPVPDLEFSGLKEEEVAILANSERIGYHLMDILQDGGLNVKLLDTMCQPPNNTRGWKAAKTALEMCETEARSAGDLGSIQSVFIGIDFFVEVVPTSWFAVTQLYVNNINFDVSLNVFAPMSPVPRSSIIPSQNNEPPLIEVTESWWNTVQGVDNPFSNSLLATIHVLQESYLSSLKERGAF